MTDVGDLRTFAHAEAGFAIDLPIHSEVIENLNGVALVAIEPGDPGAFRANINVVIERLGGELGLAEYTTRSLEVQGRELAHWRLIDRTEDLLSETLPAVRTLSHHEVAGQPIVLEQWRVTSHDLGFVISASSSPLDYDAVADTMSTCADSFRLI